MSDFGEVRKLILPGLLGALFAFGGPGIPESSAGSLGQSASSLAFSELRFAQAPEQDGASSTEGSPVDVDEDVPFSELNEALAAARSRLAELTKAAEIAKVAGDLRENLQSAEAENRQLKSVLSQLQMDYSTLQSTYKAAEGRIAELEKVSEDAVVEAGRFDEELVRVRNELKARDDSLTAVAEESASEIARLQKELDTARERVLIAERQQVETAAELAELSQTSDESAADTARLARDLDGTITELANARTELSATQAKLQTAELALEAAGQEGGILEEQLADSRSESDQLRARLETTEIDLQRVRTINVGLERQVDVLKTAAGDATDAARQNLLAVESQINEINAALASVKAEEFLPGLDGAVAEDFKASSEAPQDGPAAISQTVSDGWVPRPSPPRAEIAPGLIAASASDRIEAPSVPDKLADSANAIGLPIEPVVVEEDGAPNISLASLTTDLPAPQRRDAVALLNALKVAKDERGLAMTVPGEFLFAVDSEEIEPGAVDALASVAKLVNLYDRRNVLIVGHTDAVGDATYNQRLSERRAALVKNFFVEEFNINEDRLQVEGKGEQSPINSNATADGRKANRRVEVVILD